MTDVLPRTSQWGIMTYDRSGFFDPTLKYTHAEDGKDTYMLWPDHLTKKSGFNFKMSPTRVSGMNYRHFIYSPRISDASITFEHQLTTQQNMSEHHNPISFFQVFCLDSEREPTYYLKAHGKLLHGRLENPQKPWIEFVGKDGYFPCSLSEPTRIPDTPIALSFQDDRFVMHVDRDKDGLTDVVSINAIKSITPHRELVERAHYYLERDDSLRYHPKDVYDAIMGDLDLVHIL